MLKYDEQSRKKQQKIRSSNKQNVKKRKKVRSTVKKYI